MAKKRVYELAKELGMKAGDLLQIANRLDMNIKNHASGLSEEQEQALRAELKKIESGQIEEKKTESAAGKKVVRRRRKRVEPTPQEEQAKPEPKDTEEIQQTEEEKEQTLAETREPTEETAVAKPTPEEETPPVEPEQIQEKEEDISEQSKEETTEEESQTEVTTSPDETTSLAETESNLKEEEQPSTESTVESEGKEVEEEKELAEKPKKEEKKEERPRKEKKHKKPKQVAQILGRIEIKPDPAKKPKVRHDHKHRPDRRPHEARTAAEMANAMQMPPMPGAKPGARPGKKDKDKGETLIGGHKKRRVVEDLYPERLLKKQGKKKKAKQEGPLKSVVPTLKISDSIQVSELARKMGLKSAAVVQKLFEMGMPATANQVIDFDTAAIVASEFECELEKVGFEEQDIIKDEPDPPESLKPRAPVVTVMGHVDHGKTSLLDYIRKSHVAEKEAGGITQHIGAYLVNLDTDKVKGTIVFIDTPGHESFTQMRARGAQVTDIVILIVAADDGVMPQTIEAINHARAAEVPIIVAINKIDKPDANVAKVKNELMAHDLVPEDLGGDTVMVEISAKKGTNVEQLLEMVLLQAELMELKANPNKRAKGVVLEAKLEHGRGPVATVLVKEGTLKVGDHVVAGHIAGKVRSLIDDSGKRLKQAGPSTPVEMLGLSAVPDAGETLVVLKDEKEAKRLAEYRAQKLKEAQLSRANKAKFEQMLQSLKEGERKTVKIIIKSDVQGSIEALADAFSKIDTDKVKVDIIHTGVGGITENDVMLASASDAIIIGFNVRPEAKVTPLARQQGIEIKLFNVIYEAVDYITKLLTGMLEPQYEEEVIGQAEVKQIFNVAKVGTIAGCFVKDGKITRDAKVRLLRDSKVVYDGKIASLKRFKDDVSEVVAGQDCGILLENYNDVKPSDIIEAYLLKEVEPDLGIATNTEQQ